ncbi:MFS transporter [Marinibaculum pumilum]|uniref:MFS transporter n=1 Tax=Marinibaculum pumilum TaxID=1766165 RepID=A0ABV7L1K5_9PROT
MAATPAGPSKAVSITILVVAEIAAMGLWFTSAAVLSDWIAEAGLTPGRAALLSSVVQGGFVVGAVLVAVLGLADRFDPRRVVAASALLAAGANALLLVVPVGGDLAVGLRALTGAALAGAYPVGMKIAAGWGLKDRGFLVGLLVGALTLGTASPHLVAFLGGADWHFTITVSSIVAACGGLAVLACGLGPWHGRSAAFRPAAMLKAWTDRRIRFAILGYLGHMWELFALWAWLGAALTASFATRLPDDEALPLSRLVTFLAIGLGGLVCVAAGLMADRIGKVQVSIWAMVLSGGTAILTALAFGGPVWLMVLLVLVWGATVIPDSAQFSALVADYAPPEEAGTLLTVQTALGFLLTLFTVQLLPMAAAAIGWPLALAGLALGPAFGIAAMVRLLERRQA